MQCAATIQQLVLGLHDTGQVTFRDRAVNKDRVSRQLLGIRVGQAGEVSDEHFVGFGVRLNPGAGVLGYPFVCHFADQLAPLSFTWQSHFEARTKRVKLSRQLHGVADEDNLPRDFPVTDANVLHQAHMYRILEERVEIQQNIDPRLGNGADVLEHVGGL